MKKFLIIIFLIMISLVSFSETFYPTSISEMDATVRIYGSGNIENLKEDEIAELTVLTFQETEFQEVDVITEALYISGKTIYPRYILDEYGNKFANFKIPHNGNFEYEIIADVKTRSNIFEMEDYEIGDYPDKLDIYLERSEKVESDSSQIMTVSRNKLISNSFLETLNDTVFWVNDYVEYARGNDFQKYYLLQKSAVETLLEKKGVCDEFANLGTGILRAKGIPTRLAVGITYDGLDWGNHAWIEVYHKDFGWVPSDPTFRESGFVDATHIKIGSFVDVSHQNSKAVYPTTANMTFNTNTLPEVTIKSKKFFDSVRISSNIDEFKANQWNDINVKVKNLTNGIITAPVTIGSKQSINNIYEISCIKSEENQCIYIHNKTQAVILNPFSEKEITFKIYPKLELNSNQIVNGEITLNSLSEPIIEEFKITSSNTKSNGEVFVNDVTPILINDNIILEIEIMNENLEESEIEIDLNNSENTYFWKETIPNFGKFTISKTVPLVEEKQVITIKTQNQIYSREILPINVVGEIEEVREAVIVQNIPKKEEQGTLEILSERPIVLLFATLIGIAVILLGIFAIKRQYV